MIEFLLNTLSNTLLVNLTPSNKAFDVFSKFLDDSKALSKQSWTSNNSFAKLVTANNLVCSFSL